jgi:hypothetical protein
MAPGVASHRGMRYARAGRARGGVREGVGVEGSSGSGAASGSRTVSGARAFPFPTGVPTPRRSLAFGKAGALALSSARDLLNEFVSCMR